MNPEQMQAFFNQMQKQREQDSAAMQALIAQLISSRSGDTFDGPKVDLQPERTMDTLASSITEFVYDPELNLTFETWYARYEDLFSVDANKLDEAAKASIVPIQKTFDKSLLKDFYPALFDKQLGLCNKTKAHLVVKANCQPVFRPKQVVAYAIQHLVEAELQRLQDLNVISPVNYSNWVAPIVVIKKPNGSIRLCADFSTGLNDALETYQYPLSLPEDIFAKLNNATVFSHIDLSDAFLQVEVDDSAKELLTINTHMGLFRYNRMVFGVKTFPAIFLQIMDQMLSGLNNTAAYIDDIFVSGKNRADHDANLREVLLRIQQYGFKLKVDKCKFSYHEMAYLGYILNKDGISPDPKYIDAIKYMPEPTNQSELRSFLGAINFYGKFINHMRNFRGPLDELLQKNKTWRWTNVQQTCFDSLKDILSSKLLLTHYDPTKGIIVAADASNYGLGACIFHEFEDGSLKAICHASRSLTPAEKHYSQIEKEALAIIFALTKFHRMIFGRKFKLQTDHKPLLAIFGNKAGISAHQANRLQRWAVKLLAYDFELKFISTNSFGYADVLSRLISNTLNPSEDYVIAAIEFESEIKQILDESINKLPITSKMVRYETAKDLILSNIVRYITEGWPIKCDNIDYKPYFNRKDSINIVEGCLMFGRRIIIPTIFQRRILKEIHRGHPGIQYTKAIARNYVYWSNIDADIENMVKTCPNCIAAAKMPTKTMEDVPWPKPSGPWERLHIDYAGPIDSYYYLVVIDAFSKWPEVIRTKSITTALMIFSFNEIFARFGLPKTIVSDNGTQFTSHQFQQFVAEHGIQHIRSSPYHPMSNGQAERFVDTFKRALKKLNGEGVSAQNLIVFLQVYRSTPNKQNEENKSPAEVLLGRQIRLKLDLFKPTFSTEPEIYSDKQLKMKNQFNRKHGAKQKHYEIQDVVFISVHKSKDSFKWMKGTVAERMGKVLYNIRLQNGKIIRCHANQMRKCFEGSSSVMENEAVCNDKRLAEAFQLYEIAPQHVLNYNPTPANNPNEALEQLEQVPLPSQSEIGTTNNGQSRDNDMQSMGTGNQTTSVQPYVRPQRIRKPVDRFKPT
ncbi:uncharacterized protein K02A2.6-like [Anastrepha obliqua]|uniref:uncharacterized protein K02A2.6-like n=1 Tax=Anastrepha obliqua TaxID=95512 RepID=UPI002409827A|nr:uncharacterized protein K02A2.6-like [Anastrepha obliqua]